MSSMRDPVPHDYPALLAELKTAIGTARLKASLSVNRELTELYWRIGHDILDRQSTAGWGAKVIDRLASDLGAAFPGMKGLSARNLKYMRAFAEAWPDPAIVQQLVAQLPWGTTSGSLSPSRSQRSAAGTPNRRSSTGGAAACSRTRSTAICSPDRERR